MLKSFVLVNILLSASAQGTVNVFTNSSTTMTPVNLNMPSTYAVVFAAQCQDGIQLRTSNSSSKMFFANSYWFILSSSAPYKASIGKVVSILSTNFTFNSVSGTSYINYWISWSPSNNVLSMGLGQTIGKNYIIQFTDLQGLMPVDGLFVSSRDNYPCYFQFQTQSYSASYVESATANPAYMQMPQIYSGPNNSGQPGQNLTIINGAAPTPTGLNLSNNTTVSFTITTCGQPWPNFYLYSSTGSYTDSTAYQFEIQGSIAFFQINKPAGTQILQQYYLNQIPCNVTTSYWISWYNGIMAAGYGYTSGENTIIAWKDPNPSSIGTMAVESSSSGSGNFILGIPNSQIYKWPIGSNLYLKFGSVSEIQM